MEFLEIIKLAPLFRKVRDSFKKRKEEGYEDALKKLVTMAELITCKLNWLLPKAGLLVEGQDEEEPSQEIDVFQDFTPLLSPSELSFTLEVLRERLASSEGLFGRGFSRTLSLDEEDRSQRESLDLSLLREVMKDLEKRVIPRKPIISQQRWSFQRHLRKFWTKVRVRVSKDKALTLSSLGGGDPSENLMNFLALLELIKRQRLSARQESLFGEIEFTTLGRSQAAATKTQEGETYDD